MARPRLFLVAPEIAADRIAECLKAACAAGDVASLLVPAAAAKAVAPIAQALDVAVLTTGEPRDALRAGCDGLHVDGEGADFAELRAALGKNAILGVDCGGSRHLAMEAAEAGADYIALDQAARLGGEPVLGWAVEMLEVPCVAFRPAAPEDLDILLPQNPDFIRPADAMWDSPAESTRIVSELMNCLGKP